MVRILAFALICLGLTAEQAIAHTRSQSFSNWNVHENVVSGTYQVDAYRATQLSDEPQDLVKLVGEHLKATVFAEQDRVRCKLDEPLALQAPRGELRFELKVSCPKPFATAEARLVVGAFFDVSISHVHYARVSYTGGRVDEVVLTQGQPMVTIGAGARQSTHSMFSLLALGFTHVLSGADHVAFLLALIMLAGDFRRTIFAVTGFTVGHSITLALVALGILKPDTATVEALIGFTVAWAAGDALARWRNMPSWLGLLGAVGIVGLPMLDVFGGSVQLAWLVLLGLALFAGTMSYARQLDAGRIAPVIASMFGLAHGAGFAGPLLELKIAPGDLIWTLLAFNVGVELGQLTVVALVAILVLAAGRYRVVVPRMTLDVLASVLFAVGTFWFVSRAFA
ncbi:MAG: HupE/UreJ family protein [Micropepsaceae bacterium]